MSSHSKKPSLFLSLVPIIFLIGFLGLNVMIFGDNALTGPNQIALFLAALIAGGIGYFYLNVSYKELEAKVIHSIGLSMHANLILLVVGTLIGLWIFSGVVPAMIYYGIKLFNPSLFLPLTVVVCAVVSLATGSSWSTGGTVGIALIGVGEALSIPTSMVAGAVISGAYFGDKLSPLSDTTNLAPAMAGTDLFTHVRYMLYTTVPSLIIALIAFTVLGFMYGGNSSDLSQVTIVMETLSQTFNITPLLFLLPIMVFILVARKTPALPALIMGCLGGVVFILVFQQDLLQSLLEGKSGFTSIYGKIVEVAYGGFKMETKVEVVDSLLSRGGMGAMLNTVWIIFMSMIFGGVMEVTGMLGTIAEAILRMIKGVGSLIAATAASSIFVNLTAGDQYLAIVLPGRMMKDTYPKYNLAPQNLSRTLEDAGTLTSVLVPWNTCGAYFSTILGVSTMAYLPFCFFNLINPFMAIIIASAGFKIAKLSDEETSFLNGSEPIPVNIT